MIYDSIILYMVYFIWYGILYGMNYGMVRYDILHHDVPMYHHYFAIFYTFPRCATLRIQTLFHAILSYASIPLPHNTMSRKVLSRTRSISGASSSTLNLRIPFPSALASSRLLNLDRIASMAPRIISRVGEWAWEVLAVETVVDAPKSS